MSNVSFERANGRSVVTIVLEEWADTHAFDDVVKEVPRIVAEEFVKAHKQEIMDKLSLSEISTHIAAALGKSIAESMREAGK